MDVIEIEAKNIDEAIEKACREFDVSREKLNIEIISEGSTGFLGLGSKKAKIRASILTVSIDLDESFDFSKNYKESQPSTNEKQIPVIESSPKELVKDEELPAASVTPLAQRAQTILEGILTRMHLNFSVTLKESDDTILLTINGDGGGLLIGKRGQNLDAIQYIINKAAAKSFEERKLIIVDTESYRKRREESLNALAKEFADKVKKTRKPVTVGHMNAHDRRIIHLALQNDDAIVTKSRGEGEYRKILIFPARSASKEHHS
ncbi:MAG: R3H domain protein [Syntrophus sp. PtaB.Bin001]|nr:MAG: R3H domain protein [Syntrophus sp. PtaB.Bin001]